jgi:hypothetical protein
MTPEVHAAFPHTWSAQILATPPLIAPARQFTYPLPVPGEEDALARGAMLLNIKPANAPNFLATCALGFREPSLPSGVHACPDPDDLLAVAGGYAYLVDTQQPENCLHVPLKPVVQIKAAPEENLLLLAGFHHIVAVGRNGIAWQSARLSWEGLTLDAIQAGALHGTGWHMQSDRDIPFVLDLSTGKHTGGGFQP